MTDVTKEDYEAAKQVVDAYQEQMGIHPEQNGFNLLPTDLLAAPTINYWIKLASHVLGSEHPKMVRARARMAKILEWQGKNPLFVKHPD